MASSNNVLRGGLTEKHVDIEELSSIVSFAGGPPPVLHPVPVREGERNYPSPPKEFQLGVIDVAPGRAYRSEEAYGAEILVALEAGGRRGRWRAGRAACEGSSPR